MIDSCHIVQHVIRDTRINLALVFWRWPIGFECIFHIRCALLLRSLSMVSLLFVCRNIEFQLDIILNVPVLLCLLCLSLPPVLPHDNKHDSQEDSKETQAYDQRDPSRLEGCDIFFADVDLVIWVLACSLPQHHVCLPRGCR